MSNVYFSPARYVLVSNWPESQFAGYIWAWPMVIFALLMKIISWFKTFELCVYWRHPADGSVISKSFMKQNRMLVSSLLKENQRSL